MNFLFDTLNLNASIQSYPCSTVISPTLTVAVPANAVTTMFVVSSQRDTSMSYMQTLGFSTRSPGVLYRDDTQPSDRSV